MGIHTLEELYIKHLEDLYNAENQLKNALPRIAKEAASPELKYVLDDRLELVEGQIERLEKIFRKLHKKPLARKCIGMESLLQECQGVMNEDMSTIIRDWALIGAAQRLEHYEVAAYRTVRSYARLLGDDEAVYLFTRTIEEKYQVEDELSQIADDQAKWLGHIYWAPWRAGWGVFIGRPAN